MNSYNENLTPFTTQRCVPLRTPPVPSAHIVCLSSEISAQNCWERVRFVATQFPCQADVHNTGNVPHSFLAIRAWNVQLQRSICNSS